MRLDEIELFHMRMRLKQPFETSFGVQDKRESIILRLRGDGLEGWGECVADQSPGFSYETVGTAWHVLRDFFGPAVLGRDVEDIEAFLALIKGFKGHPLARAGLEMAFWDLVGKAKEQSLREMLGGSAKAVQVGVSVGIKQNLPTLYKTIENYLNEGYRRIKIKIKPGKDVDVARGVREHFPALRLQVDANSAYRIEDSDVIKKLDDLNLEMIEQPFAEDDLVDHSKLQSRLRTAICLDESIKRLRHARQALDLGACKIINIKPGRVGGLSEALRIHDYCFGAGIPVWCGGMLETNIGRASNLAMASLPGFTLPSDISASARYYDEDIAAPEFILNEDSTIDVADEPGLGVEIIRDSLQKFTLRRETIKA